MDTDYDLTGPEQEGCVRRCAVLFPLIIVCSNEKVTGMMRQEKSSRDQLETVIECMSLEEMEWSISIAKLEEVQECGDVIFLIVMVYNRPSTSTLALLRQVYGCVCGVSVLTKCPQVNCHQ